MRRSEVELATSRSQVRRPNQYTIEPGFGTMHSQLENFRFQFNNLTELANPTKAILMDIYGLQTLLGAG